MKKRLVVIAGALFSALVLTSCGTDSSSPTAPYPIYPMSQTDTLATRYCEAHSGTVSIESGENMDIAYCTVDGNKQDAWLYYSEGTRTDVTASWSDATGSLD